MKINIHKIFYGIILVVAIVLIVPAINYIGVAFGWTSPTQNPPGGSGAITALNGNVGINFPAPATAKLVINAQSQPAIDVTDQTGATAGRIIGLSTTGPQFTLMQADDAASKAYVDAQGGGGGGSMVLFYRTLSTILPAPLPPSCPSGWSYVPGLDNITPGYGPHYLGVLAYDWYNGGSGGSGGGFPPPANQAPNGVNGSNYVLNSVAMGSDSLCSQSQTSVVPFSSIYLNNITSSFASMQSDACFTDPTFVTECNRCVVCQK